MESLIIINLKSHSMQSLKHECKTLVTKSLEIEELARKTVIEKRGATKSKGLVREEMAVFAVELAGAASAYANEKK